MAKDAKYDHNVSSTGSVFFPLVVETLGLWTDSGVSFFHHIAACTTLHSGVSRGQAFKILLQQLSIKLWSCNAKMLLHYLPSCWWLRLTLSHILLPPPFVERDLMLLLSQTVMYFLRLMIMSLLLMS